MNKRQKKKWMKNHVILIDSYTDKKQIVKTKTFIELAKIAQLTRMEVEECLQKKR